MCTLNIFFSFCRRCSTNTCTNRWVNLYDIYPFDFVPKSSVRMWHIGLFDTYIYLSISMKMLQCNYKLYQKSSHYLYIDLQHLSLEKYTVLWNVPPFWYTLLCIQKCINKTVFWTGQLFVSDRCMYQGHAYSQGQGWKVSCDTECVCENAIYGYYRCTNTYVHFQLYKQLKYICTCLEMFGYSFQILKHYDLILHVYLYW